MKSTLNGVTTYFVGSYYEETGSVGTPQHVVTKYYYAGSTRVAMRTDDDAAPGTTLNFLLSDHLGSTSLTTDASGNVISEMRYTAWGQVRYQSGTTPTQYQYTGQYSNVPDFGLMYYGARWYDPYINRFAQADTIIPDAGNSQAYDRYSYAFNNPVRYTDPTGHCPWCVAVGIGAVVGAAAGYGIQVYDNYQHGITGADAFTTNISAEPIVNGAFIGAGAVLGVGLIATSPIFVAPAVATGAACEDGDCTNEARSLVAMGEDALESPEARGLIQKIAQKSTINPDSPIVSLGRYLSPKNNYMTTGYYTYFDVPKRAAAILGNDSPYMRAVNDQFVQNQILEGKDFAFSLFGKGLGINTATAMEYEMLSKLDKYAEVVNKAFDYYFTKK